MMEPEDPVLTERPVEKGLGALRSFGLYGELLSLTPKSNKEEIENERENLEYSGDRRGASDGAGCLQASGYSDADQGTTHANQGCPYTNRGSCSGVRG